MSFISEDVPYSSEEETQHIIMGEEIYREYDLPDIDVVGEMEDERQAEDTYDKYLGVEVSLPGPGN